MRENFADMRGPKGAAFAASALMLLQDTPLDMANYYTADTNPWGMFDEWGIPGRVYYAFVAFNQLTKTPNRVWCEWKGAPQPAITMCAGLSNDRKTASILLSNFGPAPVSWHSVCKTFRCRSPCMWRRSPSMPRMSWRQLARQPWLRTSLRSTLDIPVSAVYLVRLGARRAK